MKMSPRALDISYWLKTNSWWPTAFLAMILALLFTINSVKQSILSREQSIRDLVRDDSLIVSVLSDQRKKNVFYSTLDFFKEIRSLSPETGAFISSEAHVAVFDRKNNHTIERSITVILVSDNFWNHLRGNFTWGAPFQYQDFISDAPYAILTPKALEILTDIHSKPSQIEIEGRPFQIIGEYNFGQSKSKENASIILPLGALKLLGSEKKTYLNRFLIKNADGKGLDRLKKTIDYIQLKSGFTPSRPEFEIELISPTSSAVNVYQKGITPCLVALYGLFIAALINCLHYLYRTLNSYNPIIIDRLIAGQNEKLLQNQIWKELNLRYLRLLLFSILVASLALILIGEHLQMDVLPYLSFSVLICLIFYPVTTWFLIKAAVYRQQMIIFSEGLFPLPGKWDIEHRV